MEKEITVKDQNRGLTLAKFMYNKEEAISLLSDNNYYKKNC